MKGSEFERRGRITDLCNSQLSLTGDYTQNSAGGILNVIGVFHQEWVPLATNGQNPRIGT